MGESARLPTFTVSGLKIEALSSGSITTLVVEECLRHASPVVSTLILLRVAAELLLLLLAITLWALVRLVAFFATLVALNASFTTGAHVHASALLLLITSHHSPLLTTTV